MKHNCINIDWLEVYVIEPIPMNKEYFDKLGYVVRARDYGTPTYREMFTIYDGQLPLIEVRRDPYSVRSQGGILDDGSCHLRLSNRACYRPEPVNDLRNFILAHGYVFRGITRLDVCLDFVTFANRMNPKNLIEKIFSGEVAKINQCNIAAHGKDSWDGQRWNSLKWGSESSAVSTKLYNKTLELKTHASKYYIVDCWEQCGLAKFAVVIDEKGQPKTKIIAGEIDTTKALQAGDVEECQVWRVEFALKTEGRNWLRTDTGEIYELRLTNIDTRDKLLFLWKSLANHYFHFKKKVFIAEGKPQRKDRCPDLELVKVSVLEKAFQVYRIVNKPDPSRTERILIRKLLQIVDNPETSEHDRLAAYSILGYFQRHSVDPLLSLNHLDGIIPQLKDDKPTRDNSAPSSEIFPSFTDSDLWEFPLNFQD